MLSALLDILSASAQACSLQYESYCCGEGGSAQITSKDTHEVSKMHHSHPRNRTCHAGASLASGDFGRGGGGGAGGGGGNG